MHERQAVVEIVGAEGALDQLREYLAEVNAGREVNLDNFANLCADLADEYGMTPDEVQALLDRLEAE